MTLTWWPTKCNAWMDCLLECVIVLNHLCMRWLWKFISVVIYLCVYNDNLHSLVRNTAYCTALVLISSISILCICQKYLPLEYGFTSEEGHFLPLEEGVKYLLNPYILHFASFYFGIMRVRIIYILGILMLGY